MHLSEFCTGSRATGRTTRMIAEAKRLASEGKVVYIIIQNSEYLQRRIDAEMPNSGIKCEPIIPAGFDWVSMRVRGSHPNCVWLVDHYVVEANHVFASMFEAMTRFDLEGPSGKLSAKVGAVQAALFDAPRTESQEDSIRKARALLGEAEALLRGVKL